MEDSVHSLNFLNFTIVTLSWVEHASSDKLRTPGLLFLLIKLGNQLSVCILLLLLLHISDNVNNLQRFFTELGTFWMHILELESKSVVTVFVLLLITRIWQYFDPHTLLNFLIIKD